MASANGSSASSSSANYKEEDVKILREIRRKSDYYEILGLQKSCSVEDVNRAFRRLSFKVHPDKNKDPGAEEVFKMVSEAYQCLKNEESRKKYDPYGSEYGEKPNFGSNDSDYGREKTHFGSNHSDYGKKPYFGSNNSEGKGPRFGNGFTGGSEGKKPQFGSDDSDDFIHFESDSSDDSDLGHDDFEVKRPHFSCSARKLVLKVNIKDLNDKQKALKVVSALAGIEDVDIDMKESKITVIGDVDPVGVITKLKKHWNVEMISLGPASEPAGKKNKEFRKEEEKPKKEEPKHFEEKPKKEGEKKKTDSEVVEELVKAYKAYNPYTTQDYYVVQETNNPSSCVIC